MPKEYIIYCDESVGKGRYFSDFYGGVLVASTEYKSAKEMLEHCKVELHLNEEIKWTKVTENYLSKYLSLMSTFFDLICANHIKVRIMFRQTAQKPLNLQEWQKDSSFFLLYYQFIKHSFGLRHSNNSQDPIHLRLYFDDLPDSKEKAEIFKNNIYALQSLPAFEEAKLRIRRTDIEDVNSKDHVLLQCLDVVLGAIAFRLNDLHKEKPRGAKRRGKRTRAKEKLYKYILSRVREAYKNFNIGVSTGCPAGVEDRWNHPYRHWKFIPREFTIDEDHYK